MLERLATAYDLPDGDQTPDGGTLGLDLLYYLQGAQRLLIIDALEMGGGGGTLPRLEGDDVRVFLSARMSPDHIGVPDMLAAARLMDLYPQQVVLWGMQPGSLEMGLELSPPATAQVDILAEKALEEPVRWGLPASARAEGED